MAGGIRLSSLPPDWIYAGRLYIPPPPTTTSTEHLTPTRTTGPSNPVSPIVGHPWRKGTVLVDKVGSQESRVWLRDDVLAYIAASKVGLLAARMWKYLVFRVGTAYKWARTCDSEFFSLPIQSSLSQIVFILRSPKFEDLIRDLSILALVVFGSAFIAARSTESIHLDLTNCLHSVDITGSFSAPDAAEAPRTRLMIEWYPAEHRPTKNDNSALHEDERVSGVMLNSPMLYYSGVEFYCGKLLLSFPWYARVTDIHQAS